jgi:hypothetical protein
MRLNPIRSLAFFFPIACFSLPALADPPPPARDRDYRLDVIVSELEGDRRVDAHAYSVMLRERDEGRLRVGANVALPTQTGGAPGAVVRHDLGMDLDCRVEELGGKALTSIKVELTTLVGSVRAAQPIVHKLQWGTVSVVPFGKPTAIASADDPSNGRRYTLEVTVNRLN